METKTITVKYVIPFNKIDKECYIALTKSGVLNFSPGFLKSIKFFKKEYKYIEITYEQDFLNEFYFQFKNKETKTSFGIYNTDQDRRRSVSLARFLREYGCKPWMFPKPYKYTISKVNLNTYKATLKSK